ncbi:MAG TPA: hypothetical protein VGF76_04690 [Polyangiaceae bacterium]|jgi:hypothetical protein
MRFTQTCVVLGMLAVPALASAQSEIKQPGNHPRYAAELEPHLIVEWDQYAACANDSFGPGFRAAIPFLDNGPIPTLNNNMAIGFGLDWAHSGANNACIQYRGPNGTYLGNGFTADVWSIPVVVQWNFFLLRRVSVFGEAGLVLQHTRFDNGYVCNGNGFCTGNGTDNEVNPSFGAGGRFMVSDSVGFLVRLGFPYFSAGVSILL